MQFLTSVLTACHKPDMEAHAHDFLSKRQDSPVLSSLSEDIFAFKIWMFVTASGKPYTPMLSAVL